MGEEYKEGLRDGKIEALERAVGEHGDRLDTHELRLTAQERIVYAVGGAFLLVQLWPSLQEFLTKGG